MEKQLQPAQGDHPDKNNSVAVSFATCCDSYGSIYASYDVPLAMKMVSPLALFGDEFTNPYITIN
jgi:hypothetical protein